jgi:hypothetical protein
MIIIPYHLSYEVFVEFFHFNYFKSK